MTEQQALRGADIEIIEYHEDAPDVVAVLFGKQGQIRINGQSVAVSDEHPVKIEGGTFGEALTVTLTLIAQSLHVRAEKPPTSSRAASTP